MSEQKSSYLSDPDVLLMMAFKEGDNPSFEKLMVKYFPRVLNFVYRYTNNRAISEEIAQEVFIKVYQNRAKYEPRAKFQTWVFTIARNVSLNELRRKKPTFSIDTPVITSQGSINRQFEDEKAVMADQQMLKEERASYVREAISSLPENQRVATILLRYEGLSYAEIAKTMNTTEKAVKSLLSRAKESLKEKLAKFVKI